MKPSTRRATSTTITVTITPTTFGRTDRMVPASSRARMSRPTAKQLASSQTTITPVNRPWTREAEPTTIAPHSADA